MTDTFGEIIQAVTGKVLKGEALSRPEVALLAGFADGAVIEVRNMRQTIKVQDEMIGQLRATLAAERADVVGDLRRTISRTEDVAGPEDDREDYE